MASCIGVLLLAAPASVSAAPYAGRPLAAVLEELRATGLDLLYSSQLVRAELTVVAEPQTGSPEGILTEILAPHGLGVRRGSGRLLIVQTDRPAPRAAAAVREPGGAPALEEVLVHASRYDLLRQQVPSVRLLDRKDIDGMPGVEQDALRSLQRIPGSAASGLSASTHVRGSYEDEVLVEFDGVRLFEPFHFKDFLNLFGAIDPELIDGVHFYSGGFPARYGNRAGGVIDMVPRHTDGSEHLIGSSVFYNRALSSGSHAEDRGRWLAGYRRSNLVPVLRQIERDIGEPQFEDLLLRYAYEFTPRLSVAVGFLALKDDHEIFTTDRSQEAEARYDDDAVWARVNYGSAQEPGGWALSVQASHTHLSASRSGEASRAGVSEGSLSEARVTSADSLRLTAMLRPSSRLLLSGGVDASWGESSNRFTADATFEEPLASAFGRPAVLTRRFEGQFSGRSVAPWLSARAERGPATVELGVRYDSSSWLDHSGQFSPRLSMRVDLGERTALRATFGRFLQSQTLNEMEIEESAPQFAAPESSRQLIVGLEHELPARLTVRMEAFDRHMRGVRPRFENLLDPLVLLPEIEVDRVRIAPRASRVRGVELSVQSDPDQPFNWWGSYTWSRSVDRFADREAARSWDQRNAVWLGASWRRHRLLLAAVAGYTSGWPFTGLRLGEEPEDATEGFLDAALEARNASRYADRFTVDLRAEYAWALPRGRLELLAEVRNAFSQGNDCCRDIQVGETAAGAYSARVTQREWLGLTPIIGVNWRF